MCHWLLNNMGMNCCVRFYAFFFSINVVPHNLWLVKAKDADPWIVLWRATWAFMDFVICGGFWNQFSVATERQMTFNCVRVFTPTLSRVVEASTVRRYAYIIKYITSISIWMNFYLLYKLKIRKIRDSYFIFSYSCPSSFFFYIDLSFWTILFSFSLKHHSFKAGLLTRIFLFLSVILFFSYAFFRIISQGIDFFLGEFFLSTLYSTVLLLVWFLREG